METPGTEPYDPGDAWIQEQVWTYYEQNQTESFRRMRREGTWDRFVEQLTEGVREIAQNLIATGEMERHAWRRAIRTEVMGLDED